MKKETIKISIFIAIVLIPIWMLLAWYLTPSRKLTGAIIDKTVLTPEGQEHISLTWILKNQKFTKNKSKFYTTANDYFGFFPRDHKKYRLKGLERFNDDQLKQLSNDIDFTYITDAYGIYSNEWYAEKNVRERSGMIYGGLSQQDVDLVTLMKEQHKLTIAEFNIIGSPTDDGVREQFEETFSMRWTGWVGRYFEDLDSNSADLPRWMMHLYKKNYNEHWNFKGKGIVLVSNTDDLVVLENKRDTRHDVPKIVTNEFGQDKYGLPEEIYYSFWFDIVETDTNVNKVISYFDLMTTDAGKKKLKRFNLPSRFPAVQVHDSTDYKFYYFSADFADNPIKMKTAYFKGLHFFSFLLYNRFDKTDRSKFFWRFYRPLLTTILDDYAAGE